MKVTLHQHRMRRVYRKGVWDTVNYIDGLISDLRPFTEGGDDKAAIIRLKVSLLENIRGNAVDNLLEDAQ